MTFDILTIFPEMFESYFGSSILDKAQKKKLIKIRAHNIRDYAKDKHRVTDDSAYGGISGMVMKVEPIYAAVKALKSKVKNKKSKFRSRVILLSAKGKVLTQQKVRALAKYDQIILIAGHYKGVDERVAKYVADEELSVGEFVITGGELPAMIVVDSVSRMVKGVIGKEMSKEGESFSKGVKFEHPVYTRPEIFSPRKGVNWKVPPVLLSGNHKKIEEWRGKNRYALPKAVLGVK
jgi:tRNA (guanine37-N1)-methyltransferase